MATLWMHPLEVEKKEEMKRRDEEKIQDGLVVEEVMLVNFPLVPFPCIFFSKILPAKKKINKHIAFQPMLKQAVVSTIFL